MNRTTRTVTVLAAAALVVAACGREEEPQAEGSPEAQSIAEGPAEGTIEVWAMGAEGENLDVLGEAFAEENPDATVEVTPVREIDAHQFEVGSITRQLIRDFDALTREPARQAG